MEKRPDAERIDLGDRPFDILEMIVRIADDGHLHRESSLFGRDAGAVERTMVEALL